MSKRGTLRRKVVLPVTIIRRNGEEKQLAHTLDVTETSARLGGLVSLLEPGEIIEVQRAGVKAKFEVHWVGEPASTLSGQAGIRGIDPNKSIWGIQLPSDEPDLALNTRELRAGTATPLGLAVVASNTAQHTRYECSGGVTLHAPGSNYPVRVHLKSIHVGGLYVETTTTLPVQTIVTIETKLEGVQIETSGVVYSIAPRAGMEIAFHKISVETQRKVLQILQKLKQRAWDDEQQVSSLQRGPVAVPLVRNEFDGIGQSPRPDNSRILVNICQNLVADFDRWQAARSVSELAELRKAVTELHKKLSASVQLNEMEYLAATVPGSRA